MSSAGSPGERCVSSMRDRYPTDIGDDGGGLWKCVWINSGKGLGKRLLLVLLTNVHQ